VREAGRLAGLGVGGVILFGLPPGRTPRGASLRSEGIVPRALRALKQSVPDLSSGRTSASASTRTTALRPAGGSEVDNDRTLPLLARAAVVYAQAGADIVARAT